MPGLTTSDYQSAARNAVNAVQDYRNGVNLHWHDSFLDLGAKLMQQEVENKQQLELWNLMNEYNSPKEQMARFKDAGLNPMLIYQQGDNGNANSQPNYSSVTPNMHPHQDLQTRIESATQVIGMVTNLCQNIAGLFDTGYDLQLKRNEVAASNYEYATRYNNLSGYGQGRKAVTGFAMPSDYITTGVLNPFSELFDPAAFSAYKYAGNIPDYIRNWMNDIPKRDYQQSKVDYQQFYNEHLLPLFERYQEGKADIIDIEREMKEYQKNMLEMIPPEWRGIIEPVMQWIAPFFKFIFKRSSGNFNHNVK